MTLSLVLGACEEPAPTEPASPPSPALDVAASVALVVGEGGFSNQQFTIDAVSRPDGTVEGMAVTRVRLPVDVVLVGTVVELVPSYEGFDFFRVNAEIVSPDHLRGFNLLRYVRDIGDGRTGFDEVAGDFERGASCAAQPIPPGPFSSLTDGDFRTSP